MIEHLSYDELQRLLTLARRALRPGGLFVAETVNPHSVQAFKTFWVDPTHRAPIFPEVASTLALIHGFSDAEIVYPRGSGDAEADRVEPDRVRAHRQGLSRLVERVEEADPEDPRYLLMPSSPPGIAVGVTRMRCGTPPAPAGSGTTNRATRPGRAVVRARSAPGSRSRATIVCRCGLIARSPSSAKSASLRGSRRS